MERKAFLALPHILEGRIVQSGIEATRYTRTRSFTAAIGHKY